LTCKGKTKEEGRVGFIAERKFHPKKNEIMLCKIHNRGEMKKDDLVGCFGK